MDPKKLAASLSDLAGVSLDSPTNTPISWDSQSSPNNSNLIPNPLSPIGGDETFYTFLIPGAVFQAHDGSQWEILEYEWNGRIEIENRWIPRQHANIPVADLRRSIHSWIEPVQVRVAPPIEGQVYS